MNTIPVVILIAGFVVPAIVYGVIAILLALSIRQSARSKWLLLATAGTFLWGVASVGVLWIGIPSVWLQALDAVHLALWGAFVGSMLSGTVAEDSQRMARLFLLAPMSLALLVTAGLSIPSVGAALGKVQLVLVLSIPILGLLGLEQVLRNSTFEQSRVLKSLAVAIGLIFVINIFIYSQVLLFEAVGLVSLSLRGLGVAALAPLIVLAVKRQPSWGEDIYVSRHVVFYTTSLMAAGCYLLVMAFGGYLIGASQLTWSPVLQATFLILSGAVLAYVLLSRAVRMRFRVFLAKHFYRNRYDYRAEWLKLIRTLGEGSDQAPLRERAIAALADIIGSDGGELWLIDQESEALTLRGAWRSRAAVAPAAVPAAVIRFIRETRWVIDTHEYQIDSEKYSNAFDSHDDFFRDPSILVPLLHKDDLVGIVRLRRPEGIGELGYEDHDLLKTAGQQVAIFLIQERDQEELSETRQFEAFSKLTTFLMHDLKNLISQQELVVGNARRHKQRPEFIDDAISTMDASVRRMRKLLDQLRSTAQHEVAARVDVGKLLYEVVSACSDRAPIPQIAEISDSAILVSIDRERLAMALTHAVRNAQDATEESGRVELRMRAHDSNFEIEISDSGTGMDPEFVRDCLFRPFESTKGAKGMGIGAYQIRETVRAAGGDVFVESRLGEGTTLRIDLPQLTSAAGSSKPVIS